ncbi:hypothetical protein BIW11_00756 [Tropilaelaps mercedesae]|uniref:Uncharacterized protein n=1 Tax=Tropilaelaps mercedesae TaxID=418985 RepID=A0A1V9XQ27_9ACAR|nr:hypothetical protein BIW11_00756 [Tropilaelaps mercedesae]
MNLLEKLDRESDVVDELRHHLELVLEGFLAGSLDSTPVSKIVAEAGYEQLVNEFRPKLNEAFVSFLSALLYALKTSLIDVELIDHRAYDLSAAHERLKNLVNALKSAVDIWLRKLPEEPKLAALKQADGKDSLSYEQLLAMSCINKILISSLSKNEKETVRAIKLGDSDYSYESSTTLTVFCDGNLDDWRSSKVEIQEQTNEKVEKDNLKTFCAGASGGIPFPEYGVDIFDCGWWGADGADSAEPVDVVDSTSAAMTSTEWEDNWLFSRKAPSRVETFNLELVQMVIPKPKNPDTGITLGSLDIDALSELSENNSVASLDFSSTESESDRPHVTGAVMKPLPHAKSPNSKHGKVIISEQLTTPGTTRQPGTTIVTVNSASDRSVLIETQHQHRSKIQQSDITLITGKPSAVSLPSLQETQKSLIGPRAKATFDGKVVMENIDDVKNTGIHQRLTKFAEGVDFDRRTTQDRSSESYDEFSIRAFQEETFQGLEARERAETTGTTNSLRSFSEEELEVQTSVSTQSSLRRSPEDCSPSIEPQPHPNTLNLTAMNTGKSSSSPESLIRSKQTEKRSVQTHHHQDYHHHRHNQQKQRHNAIISNHQYNHNRSSVDSGGVVDIGNSLSSQKIRAALQSKEATESEEIAVSASVSSGRGSTASTGSASSVQSYDFTHREIATALRLSETSLDRDRSISAEPSCHHEAVVQEQSSESYSFLIEERERRTTDERVHPQDGRRLPQNTKDLMTGAVVNAGLSNIANSSKHNTTAVGVKSGESSPTEDVEQPVTTSSECDRDQDIYCVLPASKIEVARRQMLCSADSSKCLESMANRRTTTPMDGDVEQRVQRFQSSTLPNPKRRGSEKSYARPMPAKRSFLKMTSSQREVDIFALPAGPAGAVSSVDTIPVPKNRRSFTQVFPRPPFGDSETIPESADLPSAVPLKTIRGTFGVQVYPVPAPQPRPRRSTGVADGTSRTSSGNVIARAELSNAPQDVDITPMKKTVIEQDLQDKLPNVKRLASRFREPVRPGDFQSATLPTPSRRRKENARKKNDDLTRRLSQFDSYA